MHVHNSPLDWVHLVLALIIAAAYMSIPFTALRRLAAYLPRAAQVGGSFFFITCAITHLAIAAKVHESHWMVLNDAVQAISAIAFIASLSRMVGAVFRRRAAHGATEGDEQQSS